MKREFLEEMKLDKETIDKIMAENGKDIEAEKTKLTTQKAELDGIKTQLTEANKQIESFKGMDIEGIKKAADDWKVKAETAQTEAEKQIAKIKLENALEIALVSSKAKNTKAVKALLDVDKIKLDGDKLLGLDDQLTNLKKDSAYLFDAETDPTKVTVKSGASHQDPPGATGPTSLLGALQEKYK